MIQDDTLEARKGEVTVTDVDSATFAAVLHYVYTNELENSFNCDKMMYAADKYDLAGLKHLLFSKMKSEEIPEGFIPDLLILADMYKASQLKEIALEKIRANRKILKGEEFQRKLANYPHILFDIMDQL